MWKVLITIVYQDKRIAFGSEQYKVHAFLGTLHWNENVNREHTSVSFKADPKAPRRLKGKKNYKKKTFTTEVGEKLSKNLTLKKISVGF